MSELQDNARGLACIAENAGLVSIAKTIRDLLAENQRLTRGPSPTVPDEVALFRWLQENEADLRTWREPCGDDEYAIWWQVVKGRKSISGHPLGSPQDAIRAAMLAAAPAMSRAGPDIRPAQPEQRGDEPVCPYLKPRNGTQVCVLSGEVASSPTVPGDMAKDAARYRWLRDKARHQWFGNELIDAMDDLTRAVDAAMLAATPEHPHG